MELVDTAEAKIAFALFFGDVAGRHTLLIVLEFEIFLREVAFGRVVKAENSQPGLSIRIFSSLLVLRKYAQTIAADYNLLSRFIDILAELLQ